MVAGDGFEPPVSDSDPDVLPLHQPAIYKRTAKSDEIPSTSRQLLFSIQLHGILFNNNAVFGKLRFERIK